MADNRLLQKADDLIQEFVIEAKKILEQADSSSVPTKNLYHYTSFSNLKRIINNKELSFTHYRHLNDPMEVKLAEDMLDSVVKNHYSPYKNIFWDDFRRIFPCFLDKEKFNAAKKKNHFTTIEDINLDIYTFSFCEEPDHLPAWRWYGGNGTGVAIGFRPDYFKTQEIKTEGTSNRPPHAINIKVRYNDEPNFDEELKKYLELTEKTINDLVDFCSRNQFELFLKELQSRLASFLLPLMAGFKDKGYKEEKEHRLYYMECKITFNNGDKPYFFPFDEIPEKRKDVRQRKTTQDGVCLPYVDPNIPYVKHPISLEDITEIRVGPSVDFKCCKKEIMKLLEKQGLNKDGIKIKPSRKHYRA